MKKIFTFFLVISFFFLKAQSVTPYLISSAGNYSTTPSGSIAWSIGEPVSDTYNGSQIITKGFHQPKSIFVTYLSDNEQLLGNVSAFPSPATNEVQLDFSKMEKGEYEINIYDVSGKKLDSYKIKVSSETHKEKLDLHNYADGLYIFKITNTDNSITKSFRLIKQN